MTHQSELACPQLIILGVGMVQVERMEPPKRQDLETAGIKMCRKDKGLGKENIRRKRRSLRAQRQEQQ